MISKYFVGFLLEFSMILKKKFRLQLFDDCNQITMSSKRFCIIDCRFNTSEILSSALKERK